MLYPVKLAASPTRVTLSGVTNVNATALNRGDYRVVTTVACFIKQGATGATAAVTDTYLPANAEISFRVTDSDVDGYLAGITAGGTGAMTISGHHPS